MSRIKIDLPANLNFQTYIPVRITDINYGGHVGNDAVLSLIHEARMQFLKKIGYSELEFSGVGLIMADAGIEFKNELFYGDIVLASVGCANLSKVSFDIFYKLEKKVNGLSQLVVTAKTGMVCYDYTKKKVSSIPEDAREKLIS
ncbi:acyl-CoA thioesterase [Terrimonas pollutisoli]|uniref:acyl-CoA thioesterase n=1 Tax=Terrimonas pollutisoli TaxID=3034147 RepID=UPI0023EBBAD5|nr:thioesterase family protein [Terrimonas sp. H1YJ31]